MGASIETKITAAGGWIEVRFDGETVTMGVVSPALLYLVKEPATTAQRQKRTEERGRYRRMAMDALRAAGADAALEEAVLTWTHRAG